MALNIGFPALSRIRPAMSPYTQNIRKVISSGSDTVLIFALWEPTRDNAGAERQNDAVGQSPELTVTASDEAKFDEDWGEI